MTVNVDYIVIGAGMAGTVVRRFLGDDASCVVLDPHPASYKIGESIIPEHYHHPVMMDLVPEVLKLPSYSPKRGSMFVSKGSVAAFPLPERSSEVAMHIARSELESLMHARFGTEIVRERVTGVDIDARVVKTRENEYHAARLVLDCSGPAMVTARAAGAVEEYLPVHARWAYFDILDVDDSRFARYLDQTGRSFSAYDAVSCRVIGTDGPGDWECSASTVLTEIEPGTWTWQIPLFDRRMLSFGLVSRKRKITEDELFAAAEAHHSPVYTIRRRPADPSSPYGRTHARSHFAQHAKEAASMNHILIGDACGFTDPIYSVGTGLAVNKAIEVAALLEGGWTEEKCRVYCQENTALQDAAKAAFGAWYDGSFLDEGMSQTVQEGFLVGTAFQVGIATHYSRQLVDSSLGEGLGSEHDGTRVPVDLRAAPLTEEVSRLLDLGEGEALAGWTLLGAFPFPHGVQMRFETSGKPELVANVCFDDVRRFYRRAGARVTLSFMNLVDGPYPLGEEGALLFDALETRVSAREEAWLALEDGGAAR